MANYTNSSKNSASYSNSSEINSSVISYLLNEDGYFLTQQDENLIELEQAGTWNFSYKHENPIYSNLSKD